MCLLNGRSRRRALTEAKALGCVADGLELAMDGEEDITDGFKAGLVGFAGRLYFVESTEESRTDEEDGREPDRDYDIVVVWREVEIGIG